ncbi:MAG: cellulosome anchoring protein cohesin region [Rariglobus sp.]|nr:cellulosome anchoring protein cohesin region [Rariglobus sp.]
MAAVAIRRIGWTKTFRVRPKEAYNRYRLTVSSNGGNMIELAEVGFTVKAQVLPPTEVLAEPERGGASLKWGAVETATGYTVRRAIDRAGPYVLLASGVQTLRYLDTGPFQDSDTSYYTVSPEVAGIRGPLSAPVGVATPVAPPTDLRAKLGNGVVVLEWAPSPRAVAYVVRRSLLREGPYTTIGSLITSPAYTDEGLSAGTAYYYTVCGVANGKEGVDTAPVSALFPPGVPTGLGAEPGKELITLKWNAVALAASYKVLRATSADAPREEVAVIKGDTTFTDQAVDFKKTYYYAVAAMNECGVSTESTVVSASPIRPATWWRR